MKRSAALAPLSRDHQHALDVALRLRRATDETLGDAAARFAAYWEPDGERHFAIEEELVLPALHDDAWRAACDRVRDDHAAIRSLASGTLDVEAAHALGQRMHDHVRFEERELFAALEERLDEAPLAELGRAIEAAER